VETKLPLAECQQGSGALGFEGAVQKIWGTLSYAKLAKSSDPSMRKCCESDMFRAYQYTNWYQYQYTKLPRFKRLNTTCIGPVDQYR